MPFVPFVALVASLLGCTTPPEPHDSGRPTPPAPQPSGPAPSGDDCYNVGWDDCEAGYAYEPGYWECVGSGLEASYGLGYCDCEEYYEDYVYCG